MKRTFEECLVGSCAPTLAGVKAGNLFAFTAEEAEMAELLRKWNSQLAEKGIRLAVLNRKGNRCLVLVYRRNALAKILTDGETASFLTGYGYPRHREPEVYLQTLKVRMIDAGGFPHEIGVFLGYPLHDVRGFIANGGENARCCGCWKVYDREAEAECQFRKFRQCTCIYRRMFQKGRSIPQMTIVS